MFIYVKTYNTDTQRICLKGTVKTKTYVEANLRI